MANVASTIPVQVVNVHGKTVTNSEIEYIEKVADILDRLREAGEKRICTLLLDDRQLELTASAQESGFGSSKNQVTVVFWTAKGLTSSGFPVQMLIDVDSQSKACRAQKGFKLEGYTLAELMASGFEIKDLKQAGCTPLSLISAGCSLQDLKDAGYAALEIKIICQSAFGSGKSETMKCLGELGFKVRDLHAAGFSLEEIRESLCYRVTELALVGYTLYDFYAAGYTVLELADLNVSASDLRRVGYNAAQMREGGYTAKKLREVGYPLAALKRGGFTVFDLREAGFSCWVVGSSGYSLRQLRSGGFSSQEIRDAGFAEPLTLGPKMTVAAESMRLKVAGAGVIGNAGLNRQAIAV